MTNLFISRRQYKAINQGERVQTFEALLNNVIINKSTRILVGPLMDSTTFFERFYDKYNYDVDYNPSMLEWNHEVLDEHKQTITRRFPKVNFVNEENLRLDYYNLIITNPPYSTYKNTQNKSIVNPTQLFVEKLAECLTKDGQFVMLCRASDLAMRAKAGKLIQKSLFIESIYFTSNNFEFDVTTEVIGLVAQSIKSKNCFNEKLKVYFDNQLISNTENQHYLPKIIRSKTLDKASLSILLKVFDYSNLAKYGVKEGIGISRAYTYTSKESGFQYIASNFVNTSSTRCFNGSNDELQLLNHLLNTKLFIALADLESDYKRKSQQTTSNFILGCIPDDWRELDTDAKIYAHFNLNSDEIKYIENYQVKNIYK